MTFHKSKLVFSLIFCGLTFLFTSCYSHRAIGFMQERKDLPQYDTVAYKPYRLAVNDEIIYRLITMDETIAKAMQSTSTSTNNAESYRIYSDGTVDIPFLKPVRLVGLTLAEAQDTL